MTPYEAARVNTRHERCRHFRGVFGQPPCAAGVDLVKLVGDRKQLYWPNRIPCLARNEAPSFECEKLDMPPPATLEERVAANLLLAERAGILMKLLADIAAIPKTQTSGTAPCPGCGQLLRWSRARNGHTSGRCVTPNCTSWIQ